MGSEEHANGARSIRAPFSPWRGEPLVAVDNAPVYCGGVDTGARRRAATGDPDTMWSMPARASIGGRKVHGWVSSADDGPRFHANPEHWLAVWRATVEPNPPTVRAFEGGGPLTLSSAPVHLPEASSLGYDNTTAQPGMLLVYPEGIGRMLGTAVDGPAPGWLLVLQFGEALTHAFCRLVDPATVTRCTATPHRLAAYLLAETLPVSPVDLARLARYGTLSEGFVDNASERLAEWQAS